MAADLKSAVFLHMADVAYSAKYTLDLSENIHSSAHHACVRVIFTGILFNVRKRMCVFQLNMSVQPMRRVTLRCADSSDKLCLKTLTNGIQLQ